MSDLLDRPVCGRLSHGVAGVASLGADMGRLVKQFLKLSNLQQTNKTKPLLDHGPVTCDNAF